MPKTPKGKVVVVVKKVLTESEFEDLLAGGIDGIYEYIDETVGGAPGFFDDNSEEWARWIYSKGFRVVKLEEDFLCKKDRYPLIVVPFLESFGRVPTRVVFDFWCAKCTHRGLNGEQQQLPWVNPDKIEEAYHEHHYDEYHFATVEVEEWFKTGHKLITTHKTGDGLGLIQDIHPLCSAKKITDNVEKNP